MYFYITSYFDGEDDYGWRHGSNFQDELRVTEETLIGMEYQFVFSKENKNCICYVFRWRELIEGIGHMDILRAKKPNGTVRPPRA